MTRLFFSNTANTLTLSAGVVASDTVLVFSGTATGWPGSPCKAVIEPDTDLAEVVLITVLNPSTFQVIRGQDGTTAQNHGAGAIVEHRWSAAEADEANLHANLHGGVHGITGNVVGTDDVQTLDNKTLDSPIVNTETVQASATSPAAALKAATTGTANIEEWQDPTGVRLTRVGQHGEFEVDVNSPSIVPLLLKMAAAQTADGFELQTSTGAVVVKLDSKGRLTLKPSDLTSAALKVVPTADTSLPAVNFRNAADSADTFVLTTLGEITNGLKAWLRGDGSTDPLRFPLDGSKFKVDNAGNLTIAGSVTSANAGPLHVRTATDATGATSVGASERVSAAQPTLSLVSGRRYRFSLYGIAGSDSTPLMQATLRIATGAVGPTSTQIGTGVPIRIQIAGGPGQEGIHFCDEFTASVTGTHHIAVGALTTNGGGNAQVFQWYCFVDEIGN